ncbi:MAG TPA: hypothetical protein GXX36_11695 [Clostridiaceae bacterium]|nr:hypothetical protein [Clostridiaceae bacterium]
MSVRENFLYAMRRKGSSYIPFEFILCPSLLAEFRQRTGMEDYAEYYGFPTRLLFVDYIGGSEKFHKYYKSVEGIFINDWGIGFKQGDTVDFNRMIHPMKDFELLSDYEKYPYPNPIKDYDWKSFFQKVQEVKGRDLIAVAYEEVTIFETAWYLRGMDNFLIDMATGSECAIYLLDQITDRRCTTAGMFARAGCDVLRLGDDVSTQLDMMMHPDTWREYIKPRLAKVICAARSENPGIMIFYHGDGNLQKIIPDLIEIGVDILNPVQPECMNPVEIKKLYGDKLSFWGTVGTQTTMPFGSPDEVRDVCIKMINEVGNGGGLLLAPTHVLEPDVPWENIQAFIDTVREHNKNN